MDWISSDFHYGHTNMCSGVTTWKSGMCRQFPTLEKMNAAIVKAINDNVAQDDTLYHLGDWSFGGIENIWVLRKQIICKNIVEIFGNHDTHIELNKLLLNCHEDFEGQYINVYAQELFTEVHHYLELKVGKQKLILHHHPIDQWRDAERGSIMLHGHMHHRMDDNPINQKFRRMDVGLDWEEFRPYTIEEVITKMNKRPIYERHE